MPDIFISYSRKDSEHALALAERLRATGVNVWIDQHGLEAATSWSKEIVVAIETSPIFVILLSRSSLLSENVVKELSIASEARRVILPIELEAVTIPSEFKYQLAGLQRAQYSDFDAIMRAMAKAGIVPGSEAAVANASASRGHGSPPTRPRRSKILTVALSIMVLALGVGAYFLFFSKKEIASQSDVKTVAVLPFESLSSDKDNEYFADGMTGTLIDMLVPIPEIRVVDRQTSMEFKGSKQDLKSIAAAMNSRYIITGTVQRQDDKIMINAQMTDVEGGEVLFSKSFPGKTLDLMSLQQQVAQTIVAELQLAFNPDGLGLPDDAKTSSPQAHELCLKADFAEDRANTDSSISYYLQASRFDSVFAFPYLSLARIYANKYFNDSSSLHDRARSPHELVLADSFFAIGKRLDTAQEFSHFVGSWLATVHDDYDRAIAEATSYIQKQPRAARGYHVLGLSYFRMEQYSLAADNFAEYVKRCPISDYNRFLLILSLWMAHDTVRLRQSASQAIPVFEASLARHPDDKDVRNNSIPLALVWAGRGDEACKQMEELLKTPNVDSMYVLNTAAINALSGKLDRAMEIMRGKIARAGVQSVDFERPFFDNIRQFPEFQAWVKQKEALTKTHA